MPLLRVDDSFLNQAWRMLTSSRDQVPVISVSETSLTPAVEVFSVAGSYVLDVPVDRTLMLALTVNSGAGGGGGARSTPGVNITGGGGGAGGASAWCVYTISELLLIGPTMTLVVGAGGVGGAGLSVNGPGNDGGILNKSVIQIGATILQRTGSSGSSNGKGGQVSAPAVTPGVGGTTGNAVWNGGNGGTANLPGAAGGSNSWSGGGGGGGGIDLANAVYGGGAGGFSNMAGRGVAGGVAGSPGVDGEAMPFLSAGMGGGGGGGPLNNTSPGQRGGNGGYPGGGGGGGGGCTSLGGDSGAGGDGADGGIVLIFV